MSRESETPEQVQLGNAPASLAAYVCPECGGFYAASTMGDLAQARNIRSSLRNLADEDPANWGSVSSTRIRCQHCRNQGKEVDRMLVRYVRADVVQAVLDRAVENAYQQEEKNGHVKLRRPGQLPDGQ